MTLERRLLTWNPYGRNEGKLYVRTSIAERWKPYTTLPQALRRPDPNLKLSFGKVSQGWGTMQHLLTLGWEMVDGNTKLDNGDK